MIKKLLLFLLVGALSILSVSCFDEGGGLEFAGTWVYDSTKKASGYVELLEISESSFSFESTGSVTGSASFSVTSYDVDLNHIEAECTGSSGSYGYVVSDPYYFAYDIANTIGGTILYIESDSSVYPSSVGTSKPFVKQ